MCETTMAASNPSQFASLVAAWTKGRSRDGCDRLRGLWPLLEPGASIAFLIVRQILLETVPGRARF
jgi:hypothetical protein